MSSQLQDELFATEEAVCRELVQMLASLAEGIEDAEDDAPGFQARLVLKTPLAGKGLLSAAIQGVAGRIR